MFNSKIDKFTTYDNKISDLKTKKTEYLKMIQGIDEQISNIVDERRDYGIPSGCSSCSSCSSKGNCSIQVEDKSKNAQ